MQSDKVRLRKALLEIEVLHEVMGRQEECISALLDQLHNRRPELEAGPRNSKLPRVIWV